MAISINKVYQKVLAIANKEQRGYITPQEFNLYADLAQKEIFEQYFYNINQMNRMSGNSTEFSDQLYILEEKIAPFRVNGATMVSSTEIFAQSTFESGVINAEWIDGTGGNTAPAIVANANNNYIPSLQLVNDVADNPFVSESVSLDTTKKYRIKAKVSYANDPTANDVPQISIQAQGADTTDGFYLFTTKVNSGEEYFLDFEPTDNDNSGGNETYTISFFLYEGSEAGAIVNFSELSLKEIDNTTLATDVYRLGEILYNSPTTNFDTPIAEVTANQLTTYNLSPLARPTTKNPVYVRSTASSVTIHPTSLETGSSVSYNYIRLPLEPNWTYNVVLGKALYDATDVTRQDFELHSSEEDTLVYKILQLAGISMSAPNVLASAQAKEVQEVSQQKS